MKQLQHIIGAGRDSEFGAQLKEAAVRLRAQADARVRVLSLEELEAFAAERGAKVSPPGAITTPKRIPPHMWRNTKRPRT